MHRVESMVHLDVEMRVQFGDLQRCQAVANLLVEKLDSSVSVSLPVCFHSKNSLQVARYLWICKCVYINIKYECVHMSMTVCVHMSIL